MFRCSHGARSQKRIKVAKALGKQTVGKALGGKQLAGIAGLMRNGVIASLTRGIARFKSRVDASQLAELYDSGRFDEIYTAIPWDKMHDDLEPMAKRSETAALRSAEFTVAKIGGQAKELIVGTKNPAFKAHINQITATRISEITFDGRTAVRKAVQAAFDHGQPPRIAAKAIREAVFLTGKQLDGINRAEAKLIQKAADARAKLELLTSQGKSASTTALNLRTKLRMELAPSAIQDTKFALMNQAAATRSMTIARTEIADALSAGQMAVWQEAQSLGLLGSGDLIAEKEWVTDGENCEVCDSLDGQRVPLDQPFVSDLNGESYDRAPAHPNCDCSVAINYV